MTAFRLVRTAGAWCFLACVLSSQCQLSVSPLRGGDSYHLTVSLGAPGSPVWVAIDGDVGQTWVPGLGWIGLAMTPSFYVFPGDFCDTTGVKDFNFVIPSDASLTGQRIHAQAVIFSADGDRFQLSNVTTSGVHPEVPAGTGGGALEVGDDTVVPVTLWFMSFDFYGTTYDTLHVGSNGRISFGGGDPLAIESAATFLSEEPSVALLWDDLDPSAGGAVMVEQDHLGAWTQVSYLSVPQYGYQDASSAHAIFHAGGALSLIFGDVSTQDCLVGISPGDGISAAAPVNLDLHPYVLAAPGAALYEVFTQGLDLQNETLTFFPVQPGKYALIHQ